MTSPPLPPPASPASGGPAAPSTGALLPGRWFDGLSSKPRRVMVGLRPTPQGPSLVLHPLSAPAQAPLVLTCSQVGWPEAWNERWPPPRVVVDLREHGSLEVDTVADWRAALAAAGERPGIAQRMQTRWPVLLGVAAAAVVALTLFYRYGTPWAATQLTRAVPLGWEVSVADRVLQQMDGGTLKPSKLAPARQAELQARFEALAQKAHGAPHRYPRYRPPLSLQFRSGMGANAFALPGGRIVMTDGMVETAARQGLPDDALVGVLAHEIGHVIQRHSTRLVVEQGVLQMGMGLALGDVSGIVATGASVLTGLAYSRSHEREADCYAMALMRHSALPTAPTGRLLLAITRDHSHGEAEDGNSDGAAKPAQQRASAPGTAERAPPAPEAPQRRDAEAHPVWSLLSSHPGTAERARALEQGHAPQCAAGR